MFSSFAVFFLAQSRIAPYREFFPHRFSLYQKSAFENWPFLLLERKVTKIWNFGEKKMGNCFKCFEKQEDEDQLINDEDGECFLRRK